MTSTNSITVHHGNYRFWYFTNFFVQVENVETRNTIFANIAPYSFNILISSATKSLVSFSSKNNNINVVTFTTNVHCLKHLVVGFWSKRIVHLRAVNGNFCYSTVKFKANIRVFFNWCPVRSRHKFLF